MKNKLKIFSIIFVFFLFGCATVFSDDFGDIVRYGIQILPVAVLLGFAREEVIKSWSKFAVWFFVISALIVLTPGGGMFGSTGGQIMIVYLLSWIFLPLSLALILYKSIKLQGK